MARYGAWMGLLLHLVMLYPYAASGLLVPGWGLALLLGFWVAMLMLAFRLWVRRPVWVAFIPGIDVAFWYLFVSVGEAWFGWTA